MMFLTETKKMDMNIVDLGISAFYSAAEECPFAVDFLFDFEAIKR